MDDSASTATKKSKKSKPVDETESTTTSPEKKKKKSSAKIIEEVEPEPLNFPESDEDSRPSEDEEDEESEVDDQTVALLKGFEGDSDEEDASKEGGLKEGKSVPPVPTLTNKNKKIMKRAAESEDAEKPGVVYVGHIPHGFYEHEMRQYFEQFGPILQLRLSRNRKTGASKHYAFIQFASEVVADIVAKTMDNYLLFNHILKVKLIPEEQVPENLFKGANKRFKKVPWNKIAGRKLAQGASEATWEKRIEKEKNRRAEKAEKMKNLGYSFEAPDIKSAKNVAKKPAGPVASLANGEETKAIEAAPEPDETSEVKEKKEKKAKKSKAATEETVQPVADASEKKLKRTKSKADLNESVDAAEEISETKVKKQKKSKKAKA